MRHIIEGINNSKIFVAFAVLLTSLGGKYIAHELSEQEEKIFASPAARRMMVGLTCYLATRDILISVIVTFVFVLYTSKGKLFDKAPAPEVRADH